MPTEPLSGADSPRADDIDTVVEYVNRSEGYPDGAALDALGRLRLLVYAAGPVVRAWRDGSNPKDDIASLDVALNRVNDESLPSGEKKPQ